MLRRAFILFLPILLVGSWTSDLSGYVPVMSDAQAKAAGGGKSGGSSAGGSRNGGGKSASGSSRGGQSGGPGGPGGVARGASASAARGKSADAQSGARGQASQAAGKAASAQAKAATAEAAASAKAAAAASKTALSPTRTQKTPSPARTWASHIRRLEPGGQAPKRNAARQVVVSTGNAGAMGALASAGIKPVAVKQTSGTTLFKLELPPSLSTAAALRLIAAREPNAVASENALYYPAEHPDCPTCAHEPTAVPAPTSSCKAEATIGLIDTQVDLSHRALQGRNVRIVKSREGKGSSTAHGTSVAALLVGKAPDGTAGLLPGAALLATDAFASDARGDFTDAFALTAALDTLADAGAQIINLSLAGPSNEVLENAVARTVARGVDVVASVGNTSGSDRAYPAAYSNVISVTAVDEHNDVYRYANRGPFVDFAAPGVSVRIPGSDLMPVSGTSFATPFVTAATAVLRSMDVERTTATDELLKRAALDLGEPGRDEVFGWGMIDLASLCSPETPLAEKSPKNFASSE